MPFLLIPALLGITGLSVGGLVFGNAADDVNKATPNLLALGALGLVGFMLWKSYKK